MASIPACHAGDRGSIPRRGVSFALSEKPAVLALGYFMAVVARRSSGSEVLQTDVMPQARFAHKRVWTHSNAFGDWLKPKYV